MAPDIFTAAGEDQIVDIYDANATTDYIGWGTGTTAPAKGDTALETPQDPARQAATRTQSPTSDTLKWVATLTAGGSLAITEAGVFDGAGSGSPPSGGTPMLLRSTFAAINVVSSDTIEFTFTLQFA